MARIGNMPPSMRKRSEGKAVDIKPIKNTRDYRRALREIEGLMHAKRNTPAGDRLDVLVVLVEAWERQNIIRLIRLKRSNITWNSKAQPARSDAIYRRSQSCL